MGENVLNITNVLVDIVIGIQVTAEGKCRMRPVLIASNVMLDFTAELQMSGHLTQLVSHSLKKELSTVLVTMIVKIMQAVLDYFLEILLHFQLAFDIIH